MDSARSLFPSSKKINIGVTASMGDLKAELLKRKEAASQKQKDVVCQQLGKGKWQSMANELQDKQVKNKKTKEKPKEEAAIELDRQLMLSKASLERKAKLYEERYNQAKAGPTKGNDSSSEDDWDNENGPNSLVNFKEKVRLKIEMPKPRTPSPTPIELAGDEDYVEFTDSFGRTRKCLKKNLQHYKRLDKESAVTVRTEEDSQEEEDPGDNRTWEEVKPVGPVRYQELVQDEIRDHGVGFFRFSADEDERKEQLKMLENIHKEAMKQRKLVRMRKRAEKAERRAKLAEEQGVPVESLPDEPSSDEEETIPESFDQLTERDKEALAMKELLTREWDAGKRDAMGRMVKEPAASSSKTRVTAEMASKAFSEQRRSEREEEFAPPSSYFFDPPKRQSGFNAFATTKKAKANDETSRDIDQIISEKLAFFKKKGT